MIADGNSKGQSPRCGAAPHCPAGHFSPYSDGEKGLVASVASSPSPRSGGEGARRADEGRRRRLKGSVGALRRPPLRPLRGHLSPPLAGRGKRYFVRSSAAVRSPIGGWSWLRSALSRATMPCSTGRS
ncbi:MAG: hypothetical protein E5V80_17795 [Mesorhizobium sp.]|nr:MAG: hypothetical protein E5V80_17795 [Mesorhizobium sp.]